MVKNGFEICGMILLFFFGATVTFALMMLCVRILIWWFRILGL